jgi:hypothetical protein
LGQRAMSWAGIGTRPTLQDGHKNAFESMK